MVSINNMNDLKSKFGYARNSPFRGNPYLDINTPEGLIDMSNTPIDLIGIDNLGNRKKMKAGRKNPYKFDGNVVREIPMQAGGKLSFNPFLASKDTTFQNWYKINTPEGRNNIPFSQSLDYDYYSYFRNGDYRNYRGGHFPDTYKMPNHTTFSNESIYSVPENPGGHWQGEKFIPSKQVGGYITATGYMQQGGTHSPIYTSNPNDPRLQDYKDSLTLHNISYGLKDTFNNLKYSGNWADISKPVNDKADKLFSGKKYPSSVAQIDNKLPYSTTDPSAQIISLRLFKKPVQPIIYQKPQRPKDKLATINTLDLDLSTGARPNISSLNIPQVQGYDYSKPTKYAFAYPDESGEQKNVYFPDKKSLQSFMKGARGVSSQEGNDYMTATGYMQRGGQYRVLYGGNKYTPTPLKNHIPPMGNLITYPGDSLTDSQVASARAQYDHMLDSNVDINSPSSPFIGRQTFKRYPLQAGSDNSGILLYYSPSPKDSVKIANYRGSFLSDMKNYVGLTNNSLPLPNPQQTLQMPQDIVRRGKGGKMQYGGSKFNEAYNFLYEDEQEDDNGGNDFAPTAPSEDEIEQPGEEQQPEENEDDQMAMMIAFGDFSNRNPYVESNPSVKKAMGVNPYLQQTENDIMGSYNVSNLGIWGDSSHQQRVSDHNTGDAQDFGVSSPAIASQIIDKLQSQADERKVKYIIYNGKIWNPSISPSWRKYNGPDSHSSHIHVSYNR